MATRDKKVKRERRTWSKPRPCQIGVVFCIHPESVQLWGRRHLSKHLQRHTQISKSNQAEEIWGYKSWSKFLFQQSDVGHSVCPLSGCQLIVCIKPLEKMRRHKYQSKSCNSARSIWGPKKQALERRVASASYLLPQEVENVWWLLNCCVSTNQLWDCRCRVNNRTVTVYNKD